MCALGPIKGALSNSVDPDYNVGSKLYALNTGISFNYGNNNNKNQHTPILLERPLQREGTCRRISINGSSTCS